MEATTSNCEIVELDAQSRLDGQPGRDILMKPPCQYSIEDDINRLFAKIDIRNSTRDLGLSQQAGRDPVRKKAMKRTIRGASSPSTGIGIKEPVSLKQALRGLSISQASEMAAMKRLAKQKPAGLSGAVEAGSLKRIYRAVVSEAGIPSSEGKEHFMEISLVPESNTASYAGKVCEILQFPKMRVLDPSASSSSSPQRISYKNKFAHNKFGSLISETAFSSSPQKAVHKKKLAHNNFGSLHSEMAPEKAKLDTGQCIEINSSCTLDTCGTLPTTTVVLSKMNVQCNDPKGSLHSASSLASSSIGNRLTKSSSNSSRFMKPVFRKKSYLKKKLKHDLGSDTTNADSCVGTVGSDMNQSANGVACEHHSSSLKSIWEGDRKASSVAQSGLTYSSGSNSLVTETDRSSRTQEKGEFSQSSKGSIGDCTSSTCTSEVTCLSRFSRSVTRPHMSKDLRWEAIHNVQEQHGTLSLSHFKLLRKLGCGDIGTVYLAELSGSSFLFALKVMDSEFLANKKKMLRAQTEREIMQILDHPFLPTLYAHFTSDKLSCLVMEYCPGGDLHVLRQKQIFRNFPEQAARFYVAEVLLALEYLHMLGVVYRDLKPENVLVQEDGHIMLSDFDLSLRCAVRPTLLRSAVHVTSSRKLSNSFSGSSCINPFCIHPSWQVPCFTLGFVSPAQKTRTPKSKLLEASRLPQLVVEPTSARSNSFVGTEEYLAPEIIKGEGHGSAVDWWMLGIFLYELLYGETPFIGSENEDTLSNVVSEVLKFPKTSTVSSHARDLIRGLLIKEPENRLGSVKGAAEIKQHSFFEGLNWALIRCTTPPEIPKSCDTDTPAATVRIFSPIRARLICSNTFWARSAISNKERHYSLGQTSSRNIRNDKKK